MFATVQVIQQELVERLRRADLVHSDWNLAFSFQLLAYELEACKKAGAVLPPESASRMWDACTHRKEK
jgi:hypothetical protein